jgi:BMFP domain-containing protein YqiC
MQPNNPIFDDLARVAGGALSAVGGLREEIEAKLKDLVTREEFEVVRAMAQKAREENESLAARVKTLEAALKASKPAAKPTKESPTA